MNEMKPEDVMRALECCTFNPNCDECPFDGVDCINLDQLALALLREKDEEIKGLVDGWSKDQDRWEKLCDEKNAEIERVKTLCRKLDGYCVKARADAITEFAERLKKYYSRPCYQPTKTQPIKHTDVVNLLFVVDQIAKEIGSIS